MTSTWAYSAKT